MFFINQRLEDVFCDPELNLKSFKQRVFKTCSLTCILRLTCIDNINLLKVKECFLLVQ